jgi:hypothetical protein
MRDLGRANQSLARLIMDLHLLVLATGSFLVTIAASQAVHRIVFEIWNLLVWIDRLIDRRRFWRFVSPYCNSLKPVRQI